MSLVMMEGFEAVYDQSDLTSQKGWMTSQATTLSGNTSVGVPSRTGIAGTGLMLRGPYSNSAALPMATANAPDFGMNALAMSVYAAWQSGGFSVGVNATFNKASQVEIAPYYSNQIQYDGVLTYWAIAVVGGTTGMVVHSTDLQNWTATQTQPPNILPSSSIAVWNSGANTQVHVFNNNYGRSANEPTQQPYGSANQGVTWVAEGGVSNYGTLEAYGALTPLAPGNANVMFALPQISAAGYTGFPGFIQSAGANYVIWATTYNNPNTVTTSTATFPYFSIGRTKQGFAFLTGFSPPAGSPAPYAMTNHVTAWNMTQTATNTSQAGTSNITGVQLDICFFAGANLWISVGYGGINTCANPGTVGSPSAPVGTWAQPLSVGTGVVWAVDTNGSIVVAAGQDPLTGNGCIWTSTDGVTWSKQNRFLWSSAGGSSFQGVFWDGNRFILTGNLNNAVMATSVDGLNWFPIYYPDYSEQSVASAASLLGVYGGTTSAGAFVPWSTAANQSTGAGILPGAVTGTGNAAARSIASYLIAGNGTSAAQAGAQSVPLNSGLSHYYELIFTAVAGQPNQFTAQWAIDSALIGSLNGGNPIQLAGSGDTGTAGLYVNLPRNGQFTVIDDLYASNMAADVGGAQGQLGVINIINDPFTTDVSDQFSVANGTVHATAVNTSFSNANNYIYSATQGQQDVYNTNPSIPANYRVQAVQVEGYFAKYSGAGANGAVGIKSGSASATGSQGTGTGFLTGYSQLIQTTDPATNAAWTAAGLQAMKATVTKTT